MKNTKKLISIILSVMLMLGIMPLTAVVSSGGTLGITSKDGCWKYIVLDDGTISICSGNIREAAYLDTEKQVVVPSRIDGYTVTEIGAYAFCQTEVNGVEIPEGVTAIGDYAFAGACLVEIFLPSTLKTIGEDAFFGNSVLKRVVLPDGVTEIGARAFESCSLSNGINIPSSLTRIEAYTFYRCQFSSIEIPSTVTSIGNSAFAHNVNLASITIPEGIESLEQYAFSNCTSLVQVNLPDTLKSIGMYAFGYCSKLSEVVIESNCVDIGSSAFSGTALINDENNWENGLFYIGNTLCLANRDVSGECVVRDNTVRISSKVFEGNTSLTGITIPDSVEYIGNRAFMNCTSLASVKLSEKLTAVRNSDTRKRNRNRKLCFR